MLAMLKRGVSTIQTHTAVLFCPLGTEREENALAGRKKPIPNGLDSGLVWACWRIIDFFQWDEWAALL